MASFTLITGASEGLGVEFARIAAREGRNLILTARSVEKLERLAEDLQAEAPEILVLPADLSKLEDAKSLWARATENGWRIDVLVNNAGLGYNGPFQNGQAWDRELASMQVNITAYTFLMKQAVTHMSKHGRGRILNVASTAAFIPGPNMAVYHATKAYALFLSEAVSEELRGTDVSLTALCPGATKTNFFNEAEMNDVRLLKMGLTMEADAVAQQGWNAMLKGKRLIVPGLMNKVFAFAPRITPRKVLSRVASVIMGRG